MDYLAPRQSDAVELIGYDRLKRELYVTYAGGRRYVYRQVPPYVFRQLKAVEARGGSVGQYVNWRVKPVFFDYSEVRGGDEAGSGRGSAADDRGADRQRQDRPGPPRR